jgi:hypothetical protein
MKGYCRECTLWKPLMDEGGVCALCACFNPQAAQRAISVTPLAPGEVRDVSYAGGWLEVHNTGDYAVEIHVVRKV